VTNSMHADIRSSIEKGRFSVSKGKWNWPNLLSANNIRPLT